jgi:vancomycin resistance protein YoaR
VKFPRRRTWIPLAAVLAVLALLVGMWAFDTAGADVGRNVSVAGAEVGNASASEVRATVEQLAADWSTTSVTVETPTGSVELPAGDLGLAVDTDATTEAVLATDGSLHPLAWAGSFLRDEEVDLVFTLDRDRTDEALAATVADNTTPAVEPTITAGDGAMEVVAGVPGTTLDTIAIGDDVLATAINQQRPAALSVTALPVALEPTYDDAEAEAVADEADALADQPLVLLVGGKSATVTSTTLRSWLRAVPGDAGLEVQVDLGAIQADLPALIGDLGTEPVDASFAVAGDGSIQILDGEAGTRCCTADSSDRVVEALTAGEGQVELALEPLEPERDRAWAEGLGIAEPIGAFTTNHACCENRVRNIHRIADILQGEVIAPGESFSVNDTVGPRTIEKGFVEAGVIYNGKMDTDVGGGVSQFATTMFNAAFFAGLDIDEYQSHTLYISRYPYGREATISYPNPDLVITNNTPYGVLLWPTYTETSITVTLYSTPWVKGEQTGQSETPGSRCKEVVTERTRTWLDDGRTETDTFSAFYQNQEGVPC